MVSEEYTRRAGKVLGVPPSRVQVSTEIAPLRLGVEMLKAMQAAKRALARRTAIPRWMFTLRADMVFDSGPGTSRVYQFRVENARALVDQWGADIPEYFRA